MKTFYKGVICDFDGVILDSFREGKRRIKMLCAAHDIPFDHTARLTLNELWGIPGVELLQQTLGINSTLAETMYKQWERIDEEDPVPLVPGARETLFWLRRNNLKSALLTSRHSESLTTILDRSDLLREFAVITAKHDTPYHKPNPRVFESTLKKFEVLGVDRSECLFIGDTPSDIVAGEKAGLKTLVVQTGPYLLKHTKNYPIELSNILLSIDDLPEWLEEYSEGSYAHPYK